MKSIKEEILEEFIESLMRLYGLIKDKYTKLAKSKSFAKNWMKTFEEQIKV